MIGYLSGNVIIRDDPYIIVDVNGVGYKVHGAIDVLSSIPNLGSKVILFTYTHVREDALELYGFSKYSDLKLFEQLINVPGIGPRTAVAVFANGSGEDITKAIESSDTSFFSGVPRLGTKNAQKIIIELKNKIGGQMLDLKGLSNGARDELTTALKAFGFTSKEINGAIRDVDGGMSLQDQIKMALKNLGK